MRRSRARAACAWSRVRAVSVPITTATTSMTANVMTYCVSATPNWKYGGTKQKSNSPTLSTDAKIAGPRPNATATTVTPSR